MGRFVVAIRAFFAALGSAAAAKRLEAALSSPMLPKIDTAPKPPQSIQPPAVAPAARSEAITLLAALQREARFVDLVKQPLGHFSDEQIGSAARGVLTGCATVMDRFFGIQPVAGQEEGTTYEVPKGYDPTQFKLAGHVEG